MQFVVRFWYLILLAFLLSLLSAGLLIYLQLDSLVVPVDPLREARAETDLPGMSDDYVRWNYEISGVESLKAKLEAEWEAIQAEKQELIVLRGRIQAETEELREVRREIDELRAAIDASYIDISEAEEANIRKLANVYSEMKPASAVKIFTDLELELVVKILARMGEEPASRILAEMTTATADADMSRMAALITEKIRTVK